MADQTFAVGPFAGVRYTSEPYDEAPDLLHQMVNGYVPDPVGRSAAYSRPGFQPFGGVDAPVSATGTTGSFTTHTGTDGTTYNFVAMDGALYRDAGNGTLTDVTPANLYVPTNGVCHFVSLTDTLIFSNGETTPMALTSLGSTPVVATPIPFADPVNVFVVSPDDNTRIATISFPYNIQGTNYAKQGATPIGGTPLPAGTIPSGTFGAFIATMGTTPAANPTITAIGTTYTTGYATSADAQAAVAAYLAANPIADTAFYIGFFVVEASGGNFVAGTTALTGRLSGFPGDPPPWTAYGPPAIYAGSVFFILNELPEFTPPNIYTMISGRTSIAWSEPNLPLEGYRQTDYDNVWELTQTASDPLFALAATNDALYYSRRYGWGALSGPPNVNFQNTATQDVVSGNIGCVAPRSVSVFLNYVYFVDANGRPYRFATGGQPEPMWLQLRAWYDDFNRLITADGVESGAWAVVEPNVNVVLFRVPRSGTAYPNDPLHAFDALTGVYMGTWEPTNGYEGRILDAGLWTNAQGERQVTTLLYTTNDGINAYTVARLATPQDAAANNLWTDWYGSPVAVAVVGGVDADGTTQGTMAVSGPDYTAGQALTLTASQTQFVTGGVGTWTARTTPTLAYPAVTASNTAIVAVSYSGNTQPVLRSTDGVTYTPVGAGTASQLWNDVLWVEPLGLFVAVSDASGTTDNVMTSPTGAVWTLRTAADKGWMAVAWDGSTLLAVNGSDSDVMTSTNGTSWTTQATTGFFSGGADDVAFGGNRWVATDGQTLRYSTNGTSWSTASVTFPGSPTTPYGARRVTWCGDRFFVHVTDDGTGGTGYVTSTNGVSWIYTAFTGGLVGDTFVAQAWSGTRLVLLASNTGGAAATATTTDFVNWTQGTSTAGDWYDLTWAAGFNKFVASGIENAVTDNVQDAPLTTGSVGRVFRVFVPPTNQAVDYTVTAVASGTSCTVTGDANTPTGLQNVPSGTWTLFADPIGQALPLTLVTPWMGYSLKDRTQVTELRALTDGAPSQDADYTAQGLTLAVDTSQTAGTTNPIAPLNTRTGNPARYVLPTNTQTFGRGGMVTLTAYAGESQVVVYRVECDVNLSTATVRDR